MERAMGTGSLAAMSRSGGDAQACRILCSVAHRLQVIRASSPPNLTPLQAWFSDLAAAAALQGGIMERSAAAARVLLSDPRDVVVLHGDLHHDNVLDFGARGWLAIDPKGLLGERGFDYANLFCNPDPSDPMPPIATSADVFSNRLALVTDIADLEPSRLLLWIMAWAELSAAWSIQDGEVPIVSLAIAELAIAKLDH